MQCVSACILYVMVSSFPREITRYYFFTAIITMYRLFCRFDLRNPARPWRVRKYVRGANTNDHYYYHELRRTRFRHSTSHTVTLCIIIYYAFTYCFFFLSGKCCVIIT